MIFKIGQRGLLNADPPGQRILGPVVLLAQLYCCGEFIALLLTSIYPPVGIKLVLYPIGDNVKDIPWWG